MRKFSIISEVVEFDSLDELEAPDRDLVVQAEASLAKAYAPYSQFKVGAALILENGELVVGNNQENVAYPSGLCAERVAVFSASAQFPDVPVKTIAIVATSENFEVDHPVSPCGACRQALSEYEHKQDKPIRMLLKGETGKVWLLDSVASMLPIAFNQSNLRLNLRAK